MNTRAYMMKTLGVWLPIMLLLLAIASMYNVEEHSGTLATPTDNVPSGSPTALILSEPLVGAIARITRKPFGIFVSPGNSPVSPERFSGYHTGVDFETTDAEQGADVAVSAVCEGLILEKRIATGYGGIVVQSCRVDGLPVTVVYGHLRLTSIESAVGQRLEAGQYLGVLGTGFTSETSGERKHLHVGIHRGSGTDIRGYVQAPESLAAWLDVATLLSSQGD